MSKQVKKSLSQEDMTMISNIEAILSQLKQASGMEADKAEKPEELDEEKIVKSNPDEDIDDEKTKQIEKAVLENTPSESATAMTPAEEKNEEVLPETTQEGIKEVAKMLMGLAKPQVAKSAADPVLKAISDLTKVVKGLAENQNEIENGFSSLLKGMGVAKQIEIAKKEEVKKSAPAEDKIDKLVNVLTNFVSKSQTAENRIGVYEAPTAQVNKTLANRDLLAAIIGQKI